MRLYNYELTLYGDNIDPLTYVATFKPAPRIGEAGHLVVRPAKRRDASPN